MSRKQRRTRPMWDDEEGYEESFEETERKERKNRNHQKRMQRINKEAYLSDVLESDSRY